MNKLEEQIKSSPANLAPVKTESSVARQLVCSLPPPEEVLAAVVLDGEVVVGTSQVPPCISVLHCTGCLLENSGVSEGLI